MLRVLDVGIPPGRGIAAAILMAILMLLTLIPHQSKAQVLYGSLVGNVTEDSQAAIPGAEVTVASKETNLTRRVLTNENGTFSFPNLQAGTYSVTIKMAGFADFVANEIVVGQNTTVRRDAVLKVAGVESVVTVTAEAQVAQLQTDRGEIRHEIQTKQFEDLPVRWPETTRASYKRFPASKWKATCAPAAWADVIRPGPSASV